MAPEVSVRTGSARSALKDLRRTLCSDHIESRVKIGLVTSLSESRLFYNSEVWGELKPSSLRKVNSVYVAGVRSATGMKNVRSKNSSGDHENTTDAHVLAVAKCRPVHSVLRHRLVAYLARLSVDMHRPLLRLIALTLREGCWARRVRDVFETAAAESPPLRVSMPCPREHLSQWIGNVLCEPFRSSLC